MNNFLWPTLPNFYTLRGDVWRAPHSWRAGLRVLRDLRPKHLVSTCALPISGSDEVADALERYMAAIGFMIDQTMRGIVRGLGPDDLREFVRLPASLAACDYNAETYGEFSYFPPHIYHHIFGWFDGDAAHIHKLPRAELARRVVAGFGGAQAVAAQLRQATQSGEITWALQLADWLRLAAPSREHDQLEADALREMAYRSPGAIARHFALTQALALEGKIDRPQAVQPPVEAIVAADPARYVNFQRIRLDPAKAGDARATLRIVIEDRQRSFALAIAYGVAEFVADARDVEADAELRLTHRAWAELYVGRSTLDAALAAGTATSPDPAALRRVWSWFDAPAERSS
jgi:alkyl sulfatase BDS1-like metallo-beta-lactamase superfamily hydrolase